MDLQGEAPRLRISLVKDERCGTRAGAITHRRYGEYLCPPCQNAERVYHRNNNRLRNRARQRVLAELWRRHPVERQALWVAHRLGVRAEIAASQQKVRSNTRADRIRGRAMVDLGKIFAPEYHELMEDALLQVTREEMEREVQAEPA